MLTHHCCLTTHWLSPASTYTSHRSTPSVGMLAAVSDHLTSMCLPRISDSRHWWWRTVRRWRPVPVLQRYTPVAGGRSRATANGQPSFKWTWSLSTLVWCRVSHGKGEDSVTWAVLPALTDLGGVVTVAVAVQSSEETAATESYYVLVDRDIAMQRRFKVHHPCGRRSTRYWCHHHLDHPATFQLTTLRHSSVKK